MAEFTRVYRIQGLDSNAVPRFQMVPLKGKRFIVLRDGAGLTVNVGDPDICAVTEIKETQLPAGDRAPRKQGDRFFKLEGGETPIGTSLVATGGSLATPLTLDIEVKVKREQLVMFNFLRDNAGHKTNRPAADVGRLLPLVKSIWLKQANVDIVNHGIQKVKIDENLGDPILLPQGSLGTTGQKISAKGATGVHLNVFFVWNLQESGNPDDVDAVTTIGTASGGIASPGTCIFEDKAGKDQAFSMAHEIGHHLGLLHAGHRKIDLMHDTTGERGLNLSKADVNASNP